MIEASHVHFVFMSLFFSNFHVFVLFQLFQIMTGTSPSSSGLPFALLETRNIKQQKKDISKVKVPHFEGLRNPFISERLDPVRVKKEKDGIFEPRQDSIKTKKSNMDEETSNMLDILKESKNGNVNLPTSKGSVMGKKFKPPRKKSCNFKDCLFCSADKCNTCPNCLDKTRHQKCIKQMCPRLNPKCQKKSTVHEEDTGANNDTQILDKQENEYDCYSGLNDNEKQIKIPKKDEKTKVEEKTTQQIQIPKKDEKSKVEEKATPDIDKPPSCSSDNYPCENCGKIFLYFGYLTRHMEAGCKSSKEEKIKCPSCNKDILRGNLARHMKTHQICLIPCSHCNKKFKTQNIYQQHLNSHKLITCSICNKTFSRLVYAKHMATVHNIVDSKQTVKNKCEVCGKVFTRPWRLLKHIQKEHAMDIQTSERKYKCKYCDISPQTNADLKKHLKANHNPLGFRCDVCTKVCFSKQALLKHSKNHKVTISSEHKTMDQVKDRDSVQEQASDSNLCHNGLSKIIVGKRIKQNIDLTEFEDTSDDDSSYMPPKSNILSIYT